MGDYIAFVDADDYIERDMMEILFTEAKSSNLDLVICNWDRVDINGNILTYYDHSDFDNKLLDRNEIIREFLVNKNELIEGYSWNKFIKRSLFNEFNIRYPNIIYEDIPTIFKVLTKINTCKFINKKLYYYVQHNASITNIRSEKNVKGFIEAIQMIKVILIEENMFAEFKDDYFIYKCNRWLNQYITSRELKESKELTSNFEEILQSITIKKCIKLNKPQKLKLLVKVFLYKMRLLYPSNTAYQKCKSILK